MPEQGDGREKFRRACWRMLEPDLNLFWEDYRERSGYDTFDTLGKLIAIQGAQAVVDIVLEGRQQEVADLPDSTRIRAAAVLRECGPLIDEFFFRLRASVTH